MDISIADDLFFVQMESIFHDLTVLDPTIDDNNETVTIGITNYTNTIGQECSISICLSQLMYQLNPFGYVICCFFFWFFLVHRYL